MAAADHVGSDLELLAEPDSDHGELASDTGAEVLLVVAAADYH